MRQLIVSLCIVSMMVRLSSGERPPYVGCVTSEECGKGACCVIGMGRFTIPRCETHRDLGDICRPGAAPVNLSLEYPDMAQVHLTEVHYHLCPCMSGLTCESDSLGREDPRCMDSFLENHLEDDYV